MMSIGIGIGIPHNKKKVVDNEPYVEIEDGVRVYTAAQTHEPVHIQGLEHNGIWYFTFAEAILEAALCNKRLFTYNEGSAIRSKMAGQTTYPKVAEFKDSQGNPVYISLDLWGWFQTVGTHINSSQSSYFYIENEYAQYNSSYALYAVGNNYQSGATLSPLVRNKQGHPIYLCKQKDVKQHYIYPLFWSNSYSVYLNQYYFATTLTREILVKAFELLPVMTYFTNYVYLNATTQQPLLTAEDIAIATEKGWTVTFNNT